MGIKRKLALFIFPFFSKLISKPKVYSQSETLSLLKEGVSFARFGDGELQAMSMNIGTSFQKNSIVLSERMRKAFSSKSEKLLIGVAEPFNFKFSSMNAEAGYYWKPLLLKNWKQWSREFDFDYFYGNAMVTRPYFDFFKKKSLSEIENVFNQFKHLWHNKKLLIVEGEYSRFGVGDDLLSGVSGVSRIIAPSKNAFDQYDEIKEAVLEYINKNEVDIVLLSLGQTATLLVSELGGGLPQFIDIGHLDIEYNWFKNQSKQKASVEGKWVNEAKNHFHEFSNKSVLVKYKSEIVMKILR